MSDENNKTAQEQEENFTLEDILAEVKGDAFIAGEKKMPSDELHRRTEEIINEANGKTEPEQQEERELVVKEYDSAGEKENEWRGIFDEIKKKDGGGDGKTYTALPNLVFLREVQKRPAFTDEISQDGADENEYADDSLDDKEDGEADVTSKRRGLFGGLFRKKHGNGEEYDSAAEDGDSGEPEEENDDKNEYREYIEPQEDYELGEDEAIPENEPELKDIYKAYAAKAHSLRYRSIVAGLACIPLLYAAFAWEYNLPLSGILTGNFVIAAAVVLGLELLVAISGFDIIRAGLRDLVRLKANAETLVMVSCVAAIADAVWIIVTKSSEQGAPFCAVAACSMLFALIGAYKTARGYMLSFRSASKVSEMYCVTAEYKRVEGGSVLYKMKGDAKGFMTKSHKPNLPEKAFSIVTPILLVAVIVLSLVASLARGRPHMFFRSFAAMASISAPFSLLLIFGQPFRVLAGRLSDVGAAIAGWQGACDIGNAIGTVVREGDLFPTGTIAIGGVNILGGSSREKVLTCTGSLIIASDSGLADVFAELLKNQRCLVSDVRDFSFYEGGGISGTVANDRVLIGSWGFMNLMGIRLQENMNIKNAIFCAINGELSGVFIINYNPTNSVQNALSALLSRKMLTLFAVRDFNITTMLLKQKFKLPPNRMDEIEILSFSERYKLSEAPEVKKQPSALIFREGLAPYTHVILGGRSLQTTVVIGTVISVIGTLFGVLLMFYLCFKGAFSAATATNTLTYMFAWLLPTFFLKKIVGRY